MTEQFPYCIKMQKLFAQLRGLSQKYMDDLRKSRALSRKFVKTGLHNPHLTKKVTKFDINCIINEGNIFI